MSVLHALQTRAAPFVALRRDLHRHPELGLREFRTSQVLAEQLESWGYTVTRGLATTGLVGQLKRGNGGKRLGLRADMDALPIHETNNFEHCSVHAGVMHACGHDGHTAMLMAAAQYIAQEVEFSGTLNLIFQPAEEHPGGAQIMIKEGLFERFPCDAIYAAHNMPGVAAGELVFIEGPAMASSDDVTITLTGVGGHGAMPHRTQDPIVAAAAIVMTLQTIVSRNVDPQHTAVITVGSLVAGKANNVIPASARLELSVRSLDREVRDLLQERITSLVTAQAQSLGVLAQIDYKRDYPVLVNTAAETELARQVGTELLGAERITRQGRPLTGSEDFAFMLEHCPGSYFMIGNGAGEGAGDSAAAHACMVHNPGYDFNDNILPVGAAFWSLLTQRYLKD
ncbi:M20 aminoacylase family protein [Limnohabitans sp. 63ED37-2]|uniref:M20 aminoacylase family protein n=1 Tax=Limnohabitans sp. 63ED37-2 TaxID=1678128 RepID=UPI0007065AB3|nr:M20 aminoacylase family protein [Limnohabitans sp. 63ED37-2]ALK87424.1 N-acetyldiaminopimelate deacetylase [Limnohabitans sp. 63ED37-2]